MIFLVSYLWLNHVVDWHNELFKKYSDEYSTTSMSKKQLNNQVLLMRVGLVVAYLFGEAVILYV